jgi:hypothetical protein
VASLRARKKPSGSDNREEYAVIILGELLFGKVDQVPGMFHVATKFLHVFFLPLAPSSSFVVLDSSKDCDHFKGVPIALNRESMLMAWLRAGCVIGGGGAALAAPILAGAAFLDGREGFALPCIASAVASPVFFLALRLSYKISRARPMRALELARQVGIPPDPVVAYFADRLRSEDAATQEEFARLARELKNSASNAQELTSERIHVM